MYVYIHFCTLTHKYDIYMDKCMLIYSRNRTYSSRSNELNAQLFWKNQFSGIVTSWETATVLQLFSFIGKDMFSILEKGRDGQDYIMWAVPNWAVLVHFSLEFPCCLFFLLFMPCNFIPIYFHIHILNHDIYYLSHKASLVAQMVKTLPAVQGSVPGSGDPLEKGMATHSSILAWKIPWAEKPGGLQPVGSQRVGHNWVTNTWLLKKLFVSWWDFSYCMFRSSEEEYVNS